MLMHSSCKNVLFPLCLCINLAGPPVFITKNNFIKLVFSACKRCMHIFLKNSICGMLYSFKLRQLWMTSDSRRELDVTSDSRRELDVPSDLSTQ